MSTRSSLSGAKRAVSSASTSASSRTCRLRASASMLRSELETMGATGSLCSSSVSAPASIRASSKMSSTSRDSVRTCSRSTGTYSSGAARPSSTASSIACMFASGVRRSWLAHATSSRRVSKSRRRLSPISLNDVARSAISVGPPSGTRASRSPRAICDGRVTDTVDRPNDRARENEGGDDGRERRCGCDRQDLHVLSHVEHHPAGQQHRAEREQDSEEGEAGELQPDGREQARGGRRARGRRPAWPARRALPCPASRSRRQPVADAPDRLEIPRLRRIVLDLLAKASHVHRHRARVERRGVAPDARHQLVAREHAARMAREEPEQVELLRRQPDPAACLARFPGLTLELDIAEGERRRRLIRRSADRRRTLRTRATSSRGENGFVT